MKIYRSECSIEVQEACEFCIQHYAEKPKNIDELLNWWVELKERDQIPSCTCAGPKNLHYSQQQNQRQLRFLDFLQLYRNGRNGQIAIETSERVFEETWFKYLRSFGQTFIFFIHSLWRRVAAINAWIITVTEYATLLLTIMICNNIVMINFSCYENEDLFPVSILTV